MGKKGILVKIMAPIMSENLDAAKELSEYSAIRHVPTSYLGTAIIDGKHLFQFKTPPPEHEKLDAQPYFENTFYSNDLEYVEKNRTMLEDIWKTASLPSGTTLETVFSSPDQSTILPKRIDDPEISGKMVTSMHSHLSVTAIIHPLSHLNMPDLMVEVSRSEKQSVFGPGVSMIVYLRTGTPLPNDPFPERHPAVPIAMVETNPHPSLMLILKALFAGTPAGQNVIIVKPDQLELYKRGNTIFAGWTVPIPLPPTPHSLPPSCIMSEAHGNVKHFSGTFDLPSGYKTTIESTSRNAFLTYISPLSNYFGPGTEAMVSSDLVYNIYAP